MVLLLLLLLRWLEVRPAAAPSAALLAVGGAGGRGGRERGEGGDVRQAHAVVEVKGWEGQGEGPAAAAATAAAHAHRQLPAEVRDEVDGPREEAHLVGAPDARVPAGLEERVEPLLWGWW